MISSTVKKLPFDLDIFSLRLMPPLYRISRCCTWQQPGLQVSLIVNQQPAVAKEAFWPHVRFLLLIYKERNSRASLGMRLRHQPKRKRGCTVPDRNASGAGHKPRKEASGGRTKAPGHGQMVLNQVLAGHSQVHRVPEPALD